MNVLSLLCYSELSRSWFVDKSRSCPDIVILTYKSAYLDSLAFREMNYRQQEVKDTRLDSYEWVFHHDTYKEWESNGGGLLWIQGKPGSGKSTLMKKIFQSLSKQPASNHIQLNFFFHRRGVSLQQTQVGMFRTLLHQLLSQAPLVRGEFRHICEEKKKWQGDSERDWDWRVEELRQSFSSALLKASKMHVITILVDALDEAGEIPGQEVVSYLHDMNEELYNMNAATRICCACRHFPIRPTGELQIRVENENRRDIETFVRRELKKRMRTDDQAFSDSLYEQITMKASGVFLWATLVLPIITTQYNNGESVNKIQKTLVNVPSDLGAVYEHILTEVVEANYRPQALHLMQWILLVERPLSLTELRFAMAMDDTSVQSSVDFEERSESVVENDSRMQRLVVSLSGGLAEVKASEVGDRQGHYVQFIHQSVNDFLHRDKFKCLEPSSDQDLIGLGHHRLSRSCLNYLKQESILNQLETFKSLNKSLMFRIKRESVPAVLKMRGDFPFLTYATYSWYLHAEKAEILGTLQQELLQQIEWPSQRVWQCWIEIWGILEYEWSSLVHKGTTLFHIASAAHLKSVVHVLLEKGIDVEEEDDDGNRAIHYAARQGHEDIMKMLLDANANIGTKNKHSQTAIERAAAAGHDSLVMFMLRKGAAIDRTLYHAAEMGNKALVRVLLEKGAEVNEQGGRYGNALQAASAKGHEVIVRLLLEKGGETNAQGGEYGNALQTASRSGNEAIIRLLLEKGAEINAQGGKYGNALQAASLFSYEAIVKLLLEKGAEINTQGGKYGNALQAASFFGQEAIVRLLLEKGAEINAQGGEFGNALLAAIAGPVDGLKSIEKSESFVLLLIENGADVNSEGGMYGTALDAALRKRGYEGIVKLLLAKGAKTQTQLDEEQTEDTL